MSTFTEDTVITNYNLKSELLQKFMNQNDKIIKFSRGMIIGEKNYRTQ